MATNPRWSNKDIAHHFGVSEVTVQRRRVRPLMPLSPTSPSVLPFLAIVSDAEKEEWGLAIQILPSRQKAVIERLRFALHVLRIDSLALCISPTRPDELHLRKLDHIAGQPGATGAVLFPPLPTTHKKAAA